MSGRKMRGVLIYGRCILLQVPSKAVPPTHTPTHTTSPILQHLEFTWPFFLCAHDNTPLPFSCEPLALPSPITNSASRLQGRHSPFLLRWV